MPSGNSKPRNSLGRLQFYFFFCPHPSLRGKRRNWSVRDRRARGRCIWPEAACKLRDAGSHDGAAILPRPSYNAVLPPRGAQPTPHPRPPNSRTPHNAETEPLVCPTASNLRPTVARAARGRELSGEDALPLLPSPTPHHLPTVAVAIAHPPAGHLPSIDFLRSRKNKQTSAEALPHARRCPRPWPWPGARFRATEHCRG